MSDRYKTARCILYRDDQYLLAVHSSFWGTRKRRWGLPGGQIERGESPRQAVLRELEEELNISIAKLEEVGPFLYKKSLHMVYAARYGAEIVDYDNMELLDVRWFTRSDVEELKRRDALHARYELDAILALNQRRGV